MRIKKKSKKQNTGVNLLKKEVTRKRRSKSGNKGERKSLTGKMREGDGSREVRGGKITGYVSNHSWGGEKRSFRCEFEETMEKKVLKERSISPYPSQGRSLQNTRQEGGGG